MAQTMQQQTTPKINRVITYIDGFNFYFGIKSAGWNDCLWLNPCTLTENLLKENQLLCDAFEDSFDTALIVSGDSDLTPPIEAIRARFPHKKLIVVFPPKRHSVRLATAANASFQLGRKLLKDSQFPDEYPKADGYVLKRPTTWN
jgi:hypothetical protein